MRILLVDDELVSLAKAQKIMSAFGECVAARTGREAVEAFVGAWGAWRPFSLICLDIAMPDMDGTEVLFEIRRLEEEKGVEDCHRVKVLMVSSHTDRDTVVTCVQAGCDGYISKPFNGMIIKDKLADLGLI